MYKSLGFSLLELMITVAVIAILAAIALPAYQDYVIRAQRSDGKDAILSIQLAQEKWRANHSTYGSLTNLGLPDPYVTDHYSTTVSGTSATGYTITAAPTGSQATKDTECASFVTNQSNLETITGTGSATGCWNR